MKAESDEDKESDTEDDDQRRQETCALDHRPLEDGSQRKPRDPTKKRKKRSKKKKENPKRAENTINATRRQQRRADIAERAEILNDVQIQCRVCDCKPWNSGHIDGCPGAAIEDATLLINESDEATYEAQKKLMAKGLYQIVEQMMPISFAGETLEARVAKLVQNLEPRRASSAPPRVCLLYTSDAADE